MLRKETDFKRNIWTVLGVPFDQISLDGTIAHLHDSITQKKPCFLSTPNLNFVISSHSDRVFFQSILDSDLVIADGMPIIWIAKLLGIPIKERVAGSTLFDELSSHNYRKKIKVFFFGGQEGIAEKAHQALNESSSFMESCGFYDPGFVSVEEMSSDSIIKKINEAEPDFIVVALGAKKGQAWIQKNKHQLKAYVISHLGAVINFVAGSIVRAPVVWQRLGLEWIWRILQEPALWKRYFYDGLTLIKLVLTKVIPLAIYDRVLKVVEKKTSGFHSSIESINQDRLIIHISGYVDFEGMAEIKTTFQNALKSEHDVDLNFSQLRYCDPAFIGSLLLFKRYLDEQNKQLVLKGSSTRIKRIFKLNNVYSRFVIL